MGEQARTIIGMDADELIKVLNRAFADEWLAHYQYWIGAKVIKGPMKDAVAAELVQHATEEMLHADMVSNRIIQLGGTPVLEPKEWYAHTNCGYDAPSDPFVAKLLEQNIKGERCAIKVYKALMDMTQGKDMITYNMALKILEQEVEHEEDLQALAEDLELLYARAKK